MRFLKFIILVIIVVLTFFYFSYMHGISTPVSSNSEEVKFLIDKGEGVSAISKNLLNDGLIGSELFFKIYIWREGLQTTLQAGEYNLSKNLSIMEIVEKFSTGKALSKERTIKIIEGWNIDEINNYLKKEEIVGDTSFSDLAKKTASSWYENYNEYEFLKDAPSGVDLEGFLFPDTYRIYTDATNEDVLIKMLDNFDKKLSIDLREEIKKQGKSIFEIITMASIIQKEVRSVEDMKIVSGIFWNRINYKQALESCATLAYILGENKPQYTLEDTKTVSPYNTYQNQGLPPGPISNPGLDAIEAAIYPTDSDYFYFLSRFDNGETIFSKTYDEHLRNKAKYLK